ncbi:Uncharacterized protein GBIM_05325 [Gryllus bimaculatus]|nr:Uncharacterized protein GBIM_05325 [Gryllus bimaculatus]
MASHTKVDCSSYQIVKSESSKLQHVSSALPLKNISKTRSAQLCDALRLKVQQSFLEKTQKILICTLKNLEPHHIKDLNDYNEESIKKRLQESEKLQKEVIAVVQLLKNIKNDVTIEKLKEINIAQFEASLMDLDNKMSMLKDMCGKQITFLRHQEQELQVHVTSVSNKIDEWSKPIKVDAVLPSVHQTAVLFNSGSNYNENISSFQKFLQIHGGHTGGWDEGDHITFIRLLRKYPNKQMLYTHLQEEFPDKQLEELKEHCQWFAEYEDLKVKQKQAITDWRASKNYSLRKTMSCSAPLPVHTIAKEEKKLDFCTSEYREQQKQQLEQWKNMKELEAEMKVLKKKEEQQKQLIEEETRKLRHAIQKAEVEKYKKKKLKEELAVALEKQALENAQAEERAYNANKSLKVFRQRDLEVLTRQKEMKDKLQQERTKKQKALEALRETVRIEAARDPHRLLRPTGAWRERTKVTRSADAGTRLAVPLNVQQMPHL